jgi:hypothetical protein
MKALRASQMNKPPPVAMKLNKVRTWITYKFLYPHFMASASRSYELVVFVDRLLSMRRRLVRWKNSCRPR